MTSETQALIGLGFIGLCILAMLTGAFTDRPQFRRNLRALWALARELFSALIPGAPSPMDDLDHGPWRDWRRVEACLRFGLTRWLWTFVALSAADQYLRPVSWWLEAAAAIGILMTHEALTARADARRVKAIVDSVAELMPAAKD